MKGLIALPYEVLSNIVSSVDFDDVVSLGRTCKFFKYLHTEESICKNVVQVRHRPVLAMWLDTVRNHISAADKKCRKRFASPMRPGPR
jgi:hypothetical protein